MLTLNALEEKILAMANKGIGRKKIALTLGITEWKVRCVVREEQSRRLYSGQAQNKKSGGLRLGKVKKSSVKPKTAIVLSDIHIPYHDQKNLAVALAYAEDIQPDDFILNGDVSDCYQASSYTKDPTKVFTLQDEIRETREFLAYTNKILPKARKLFVSGNHEDRIERTIMNEAPMFASMGEFSIEEIFQMHEHGYDYIDKNCNINLGDLEIFHGSVVRRHSGASAKAHHEKTGGSVLIGHVHRQGSFFVTNKWGTHSCIENGHLCDVGDIDYTQRPNWQAGFTEVKYFDDGFFTFRQHQCNNGVLIVDDRKYEV